MLVYSHIGLTGCWGGGGGGEVGNWVDGWGGNEG